MTKDAIGSKVITLLLVAGSLAACSTPKAAQISGYEWGQASGAR